LFFLSAPQQSPPSAVANEPDNNKIDANENSSNNNNALSSPDNSDDFVLVPIPTDGVDNKQRNVQRHNASPPRPSSLPISEAKPVPLLQPHARRLSSQASPKTNPGPGIPRSQPITMKRPSEANRTDMSSISPPAVQFAIGTPPIGSRRRSTSGGSLSGTPPPSWQVSPASHQSPLRRSDNNSSPNILPQTVALSKCLPALGSPTLLAENVNNNATYNIQTLQHHGLSGRAITLPDLATGGFQSLLHETNIMNDFAAPELPAETLLDRDHNETLAKLNFVLALTDCILEVANARCAPLSALMSVNAASIPPHAPENCKRAERLVLLVRALHLLSSGLNLASQNLQQGQLQASKTVKNGNSKKYS
jgi:serine/threonine-protein kinase ULK2